VPGATATATQGDKKFTTITNQQGLYSFPDLPNGTWTIEIEMTGFSIIKQDVVIGPNAPAAKWELKLLPLDQINGQIKWSPGLNVVAPQVKSEQPKPPGSKTPEKEPSEDDLSQRAANGFLINGSKVNGAASPFAQAFAFGNPNPSIAA
jgi:hypothetical protein